MSQPDQLSSNDINSLKVQYLGQLLIMQSVVISLPDEQAIFHFVIRGLRDLPGVTDVKFVTKAPDITPISVISFPLLVNRRHWGSLLFSVSDQAAFLPYEAYIKNFCFMLAVILEERKHRQQIQQHQQLLETEVKERTRKLQQSENALLQAKNAAEEAYRTKSRFIDIAAHELRTPVTTFSLLVQVCQEQLKAGLQVSAEILSRLRAQSDRLSRLVFDLLDVSRMERGVLALQLCPANLSELVTQIVEEFKIQVPDRSLHLSGAERPIEVRVDPTRIQQVVSNLLDNAIKYAAKSTPIEVRIEALTEQARVSVIDHGPGLSADQQAKLFLPFSSFSASPIEKSCGMGLGLFISKRIIELHGGKLSVKSRPGEGSIFFFELPYHKH